METAQRKKKVLYVITKSNFGGAQRYIYDITTNLNKEVYEPVVALGGTGDRHAPQGVLQHLLEEKQIRIVPVLHFMRDMSISEDIGAFFELVRIIKKEKPDVLHVTSSKAGGLGALAGRIARVPHIIFTSHGLAYDELWRPLWQRMLIWISSWCTMLLSTNTIQISEDTYRRAQRMPFLARKIVLIHNGIKPPHYMLHNDARAFLDSHHEASSVPWIGTLAELTSNKNLEILIEALALLHAEGISAHLWLIGAGEKYNSLIEQASKCGLLNFVHLPGYLTNASCVLQAFDVFVLPSRKEGLPYVLLEAGYASLPVVVSKIAGVRDIVTHEKNGLMVEADAKTFATALARLLKDTTLRTSLGQALLNHVSDSFSVERMVQKTTELYSASKPSSSLSSLPRRTECS
ncbi:MAG: Glycosyltransferase, group 1 family [Parcubacteria group bacterium GW2011_GWC2_42_11]|nr:MAG: Glycosyltransferase, group 1 family [Parcubacteria group bacterium GW2011_GWC2_42_11]